MTKRTNSSDGSGPTTDSVVTANPAPPAAPSSPAVVGGIGGAGGVTSGSHAMRRGGARREVTERVLIKDPQSGTELEGWALNLSRGGLRAILEEKVDLGAEYLVTLGEGEDVGARRARVVWVQEEPDGVIVGVEFVGLSGIHMPQANPSGAVGASSPSALKTDTTTGSPSGADGAKKPEKKA